MPSAPTGRRRGQHGHRPPGSPPIPLDLGLVAGLDLALLGPAGGFRPLSSVPRHWGRTQVISGLAAAHQVVLWLDRRGEAGARAVAEPPAADTQVGAASRRPWQGATRWGRYRLDRMEATTLAEGGRARLRSDRIGSVFQSFHRIPQLTAFENLELPLVLAGVASRDRRPRLERTLAAVGLAEPARYRPDQLSRGQRQRVAIARAWGAEVIETLKSLKHEGLTLIGVTRQADLGARAPRRIAWRMGLWRTTWAPRPGAGLVSASGQGRRAGSRPKGFGKAAQ